MTDRRRAQVLRHVFLWQLAIKCAKREGDCCGACAVDAICSWAG
jgi:hypothetical protein